MSAGSSTIKIGLVTDGIVQYLTNVNKETLTYDLVESGGEIFPVRDGAQVVSRLREKEQDKMFVVLP